VPKPLGTLYMRAYGTRNSHQIIHGDQTTLEEKFYRVDHATCQFFENNADARSVCGS